MEKAVVQVLAFAHDEPGPLRPCQATGKLRSGREKFLEIKVLGEAANFEQQLVTLLLQVAFVDHMFAAGQEKRKSGQQRSWGSGKDIAQNTGNLLPA